MYELQLRNLLNSLSHLAAQGDIPVHAFGTLIRSAHTDVLAEQLHRRWLADRNFGHVAARILSYSHNDERRDMRLCSQVVHLLLDDYKNREQLRREDRRSFRNYCNALVELLRVYLKVDEFLGEGLIAPFFVSAHMLVDGASDDDDLQCFGAILVREGALLAELNTFECERLVIKARAALCFHERPLRSYTRFVLLHAIELCSHKWQAALMLPELVAFYADQHERLHASDGDEVDRWMRSESSLTVSTLSRAETPEAPSPSEALESVV